MTQEDKELLLRDLSARLPYHCRIFYEYVDDLDNKTYGYSLTLNTWCIDEFNADKAVVKPYLRPMSSMTEEEKVEYYNTMDKETQRNYPNSCDFSESVYYSNTIKTFDWLNEHHFDYRDLIPMDLAIEITKENNPYKEEQLL